MKRALGYESAYESKEIPQEWQPPKLKSMNPKAGPVAGGQQVKIEFAEALPYNIASVKFDGAPAEKTFKPPSILVVTTPASPYGEIGKVKIQLQTVYDHVFELDQQYEYVEHAGAATKAPSTKGKSRAALSKKRAALSKKKAKAPAKPQIIAAAPSVKDDGSPPT